MGRSPVFLLKMKKSTWILIATGITIFGVYVALKYVSPKPKPNGEIPPRPHPDLYPVTSIVQQMNAVSAGTTYSRISRAEAEQIAESCLKWAEVRGFDWPTVLAIPAHESFPDFNPWSEGDNGTALGLWQIREIAIRDLYDPSRDKYYLDQYGHPFEWGSKLFEIDYAFEAGTMYLWNVLKNYAGGDVNIAISKYKGLEGYPEYLKAVSEKKEEILRLYELYK